MKPLQRLFIFDRRELSILTLMIIVTGIFTFTLGIHLGKQLGIKGSFNATHDKAPVHTLADQTPDHQELTRVEKSVPQSIDETLHAELHQEVKQAGIHMDTPRQVDLPKHAKSLEAGATSLTSRTLASSHIKTPTRTPAHSNSEKISEENESGKYALQIGSFHSLHEAKKHLIAIKKFDLKPSIKEADIKGRGKRYRLFLGEYPSRYTAEHAGESFKSKHKIKSFIVVNLQSQ